MIEVENVLVVTVFNTAAAQLDQRRIPGVRQGGGPTMVYT
jgi:hypothetical protein